MRIFVRVRRSLPVLHGGKLPCSGSRQPDPRRLLLRTADRRQV